MKIFIGTIVSNAMKKTVVVRVDALKMHSKYRKQYKVQKRYMAHDELGTYHTGDVVKIQETRPLSRMKRWRVVELVKRANVAEPVDEIE